MYFSYTVMELAKALAAIRALHSQLGGGISPHCCCDKSPPTLWLEATPFVTSSSPGQRSGMVWLSRGSHKAKVKVSIGLGSYLDALGQVHLWDHSGCWQNPVPRRMPAGSLSQLLKATTFPIIVFPPPASGKSGSSSLYALNLCLPLLLHFSDSSQRKSSAFEDS